MRRSRRCGAFCCHSRAHLDEAWGNAEDIGGVVAHICSDDARLITGAIVPIDGGYAAM